MKNNTGRRRLLMAALSAVILGLCVLIVLVFHKQPVVRGFLGDVLVVMLFYTLCQIIRAFRPIPLALGILAVAVVTEVAQLFHVIRLLGLEENLFTRLVFGSVFDWFDLAAYFLGCALAAGADLAARGWLRMKKLKREE